MKLFDKVLNLENCSFMTKQIFIFNILQIKDLKSSNLWIVHCYRHDINIKQLTDLSFDHPNL